MAMQDKGSPLAEEVRVTSDSGASKGQKLAAFSSIPADSLQELAEHFGKGALKYPPLKEDGNDNWRHGYPWSSSFSALMRHAWQFWGGEDADEETGSKHLVAVAWHALVMAHWMNSPEMSRYDDRPTL